jgi:hypothetical protein
MNTTVTLDLVQTAIYAAVAIGGYFLNSSGLLGKIMSAGQAKTPMPGPIAAPTPVPGPQPAPSPLGNIAAVFEQQLLAILQDAVKRLVQPPAVPPIPATGATSTPPSNGTSSKP